MRVGEEFEYMGLLFCLPGMARGVIDFLDESHWVIRQQRPEEEWKIQYACFYITGHREGKGGVELSFDDIVIQRELLMIDSRAPGLKKGQERFVEVAINAVLEKRIPWEMQAMMNKFGDLSLDREGPRIHKPISSLFATRQTENHI